MRTQPYGQHALLVDVDDHHDALALYQDLQQSPVEGTVDVVPAASTVLIVFVDQAHAARARPALEARTPRRQVLPSVATLEIPVVYNGPDLPTVAELTTLPVHALIDRHQAGEYIVAFMGFAPGFGYLTGLDPSLHLPRRGSPRTRVPPGSLAIAGEFTAVYPGASPGGWHLIGRTSTALWDLDREPAALLSPGTRVRFRSVIP